MKSTYELKNFSHIKKTRIMELENVLCKCGSACMVIIFGSIAVGFLACFGALIYLIVCMCGA